MTALPSSAAWSINDGMPHPRGHARTWSAATRIGPDADLETPAALRLRRSTRRRRHGSSLALRGVDACSRGCAARRPSRPGGSARLLSFPLPSCRGRRARDAARDPHQAGVLRLREESHSVIRSPADLPQVAETRRSPTWRIDLLNFAGCPERTPRCQAFRGGSAAGQADARSGGEPACRRGSVKPLTGPG